jgi:hypothetical protein
MDSGWFPTFLEAFFESFAAIALPIWRVFKGGPGLSRIPLTEESSWEVTWKLIEELRVSDPTTPYHCSHSISFARS